MTPPSTPNSPRPKWKSQPWGQAVIGLETLRAQVYTVWNPGLHPTSPTARWATGRPRFSPAASLGSPPTHPDCLGAVCPPKPPPLPAAVPTSAFVRSQLWIPFLPRKPVYPSGPAPRPLSRGATFPAPVQQTEQRCTTGAATRGSYPLRSYTVVQHPQVHTATACARAGSPLPPSLQAAAELWAPREPSLA